MSQVLLEIYSVQKCLAHTTGSHMISEYVDLWN